MEVKTTILFSGQIKKIKNKKKETKCKRWGENDYLGRFDVTNKYNNNRKKRKKKKESTTITEGKAIMRMISLWSAETARLIRLYADQLELHKDNYEIQNLSDQSEREK